MEANAMLDPSSEGGTLQESSDEDDVPRSIIPERVKSWRNFSGFWILGLCNNFSYVIMLSAAHDILSGQGDRNATGQIIPAPNDTGDAEGVEELSLTGGEGNGTGRYDCNPISTAAILLADILPTLLIKLTAPFYIHHIPYGYRVVFCIISALASFLLVSLSVATWISILGVVFASASSGLGEFTFLSLTSFFHSDVVCYWSSGTGFAGLLGAFSYSGLTQSGLSPRNTVLLMVIIPVLLCVSYFRLLQTPPGLSNWQVQTPPRPPECQPIIRQRRSGVGTPGLSLWTRLRIIRGLLKYMIPLGLIYFAEYFINQGLFELLYFRNSILDHSGQYRWYQTLYQIGVFVSRSSGNCVRLRRIWILAILQLLNLALMLFDVWYAFIPNIWIIFAIILYEGLLGGAGYVNTFRNITLESPEEEREFAMGAASVADTLGIAISGAVALPFHNQMCRRD